MSQCQGVLGFSKTDVYQLLPVIGRRTCEFPRKGFHYATSHETVNLCVFSMSVQLFNVILSFLISFFICYCTTPFIEVQQSAVKSIKLLVN